MNQRQISAVLVLDGLGLKEQMRMQMFTQRLCVQKAVYLAQAAEVHLGYHFNWYLRGPYSPALTQDVFDAIENHDPEMVLQGYKLDQNTHEKLAKLQEAFNPPHGLEKAGWLELLASVHFLIDRKQALEVNAGGLATQLRKFDKDFTTKQVDDALKTLRDAGLLPPT